jgi:hypothetical protein
MILKFEVYFFIRKVIIAKHIHVIVEYYDEAHDGKQYEMIYEILKIVDYKISLTTITPT